MPLPDYFCWILWGHVLFAASLQLNSVNRDALIAIIHSKSFQTSMKFSAHYCDESLTKRHTLTMTKPKEFLKVLRKAMLFSTLDLTTRYHHIMLTWDHCEHIAFITGGQLIECCLMKRGLYEDIQCREWHPSTPYKKLWWINRQSWQSEKNIAFFSRFNWT